MTVRTYRDKPRPAGVSYAAQYTGPESFPDLLEVAKQRDSHAEVAHVPGFDLALVRTTDDHGNPDYDVVEQGSYLVYGKSHDVLYTSDPESFDRGHEAI